MEEEVHIFPGKKTIFPELLMLKKFFPEIFLASSFGKLIPQRYIEEAKYVEIKELFSTYGINDQQTIDNYCEIVNLLNGLKDSSIKMNKEEKEYWDYTFKRGEIKQWLKKHKEVLEIRLKGINSGEYLSVKDQKLIIQMIQGLKLDYDHILKRGKGNPLSFSGHIKKLYKHYLEDYFSKDSRLNDLPKADQDYIKGRLFLFARILDSFQNDKKERAGYLNERDYLIHRWKKI